MHAVWRIPADPLQGLPSGRDLTPEEYRALQRVSDGKHVPRNMRRTLIVLGTDRHRCRDMAPDRRGRHPPVLWPQGSVAWGVGR